MRNNSNFACVVVSVLAVLGANHIAQLRMSLPLGNASLSIRMQVQISHWMNALYAFRCYCYFYWCWRWRRRRWTETCICAKPFSIVFNRRTWYRANTQSGAQQERIINNDNRKTAPLLLRRERENERKKENSEKFSRHRSLNLKKKNNWDRRVGFIHSENTSVE